MVNSLKILDSVEGNFENVNINQTYYQRLTEMAEIII